MISCAQSPITLAAPNPCRSPPPPPPPPPLKSGKEPKTALADLPIKNQRAFSACYLNGKGRKVRNATYVLSPPSLSLSLASALALWSMSSAKRGWGRMAAKRARAYSRNACSAYPGIEATADS